MTKKKKISEKLRKKYRLVLMNDATFEEKLSFRLSRMNVFLAVASLSIVLIFLTTYLIAFTPLKEFIPDYASDVRMRYQFYNLSLKTDSLQKEIQLRDQYVYMLKEVVEGNVTTEKELEKMVSDSMVRKEYENLKDEISSEELLFREETETADQYTLLESASPEGKRLGIAGYYFFSPINGIITNEFNMKAKHYGVDVTAKPNEAVKSTLDGTVVFADWSIETGYVIAIQHSGDLVSVYKHNSSLLKKQGESVKAGEPIAIIGNTGRMTTGPHLHFELWHNGSPINPIEYMTF